MKKFLSTVSILTALAGTASAAPYVLPSQQSGALSASDLQPAFELDAALAFGGESGVPDMYGPRLSFNLYSGLDDNFLHQFNINIGALWGSETIGASDLDAFMMPLTAGYDINIACTDNLFFYMGAKAGYAWTDFDYAGHSHTDGGFTWAVGAGFKYFFSEAIYGRVGYEYGRTYLDDNFCQHTVLIGVGCQF